MYPNNIYRGRVQRCSIAVLVAIIFGPLAASAQTFPLQIDGRISKLWVDQSDLILELGTAGPCGGIYYVVPRTLTNFQEMNAMALTAGAGNKLVRLELSGCSGSNHIVSHGAIVF